MSLSLGTLEIGLGLNTAQYDSGIKSAKDQLSSLEDHAQKITRDIEWSLKQSIPKLTIVPVVDHRPLHGLNKHLSEKEKHIDRVSKKVIRIKVDDSELQEIANKTVIVQASVQSKGSSQKYSNEIKQKVEVSIKNANLELLTEIKAVTKEIKEVVKSVSRLKPTAIGTISNSLIQGIGFNLTKSFSQGFEQSFTKKTGFNFESAGQKTGNITASSVQFVQPVLNKLVDTLQIKIDKITGRDKPIGERILTASETFQKIQTKIGVSNNNPYTQKSIDNSIASFQNMLSVLGSGEFSKFPEASQKAITSLTELLNLISSENDLGELTKDLADLLKITIAFSGKDFLQIIKQSHSLLKTQKALEGSSAEFIGALKQAVSEQKIIEQGFRLIARENHKSFFVNDEGKYIGTDNVGGRVIGFTATPKQSMPGVGQDIYEIAFSLDSQFSSLGDAAQLTKKEVIQLKNSVSEFFNKFVSNTNEAILTASPENADQKGKRRGSIYQRFGFVPEGEGNRLVAQISSRKIVEPNLKFNLKQNEQVTQISKQIEQRLTTTLGTFDNLFQHSISQAIQYAKSIIVGSELIQQDLEQLQKEAQNAEYDDSPAIQSQNKINQNLKNLQARIKQSKRLQNDPILRDFSKIDITNIDTLVPKEQLAKIALKITKITENVPKEIVKKLLERVAQFQPEEIIDPTLLGSIISSLTKDIQTQLTGVTPQLKMFGSGVNSNYLNLLPEKKRESFLKKQTEYEQALIKYEQTNNPEAKIPTPPQLSKIDKQTIAKNLRIEDVQREVSYVIQNANTLRKASQDAIDRVNNLLAKVPKNERFGHPLASLKGNLTQLKESAENVNPIYDLKKLGVNKEILDAIDVKSQVIPEMTDTGSSIVSGLVQGLNSKLAELETVSIDIASIPLEITKQINKIQSPSKEFEKVGKNIVEGEIKGIKSKEKDLQATMAIIAKNMIENRYLATKNPVNIDPFFPHQIEAYQKQSSNTFIGDIQLGQEKIQGVSYQSQSISQVNQKAINQRLALEAENEANRKATNKALTEASKYTAKIRELSEKDAERTRKHKAEKEAWAKLWTNHEAQKKASTQQLVPVIASTETLGNNKIKTEKTEEELPLYTPSSIVEKKVQVLKESGQSTNKIEKMLAESAKKSEELFLKEMTKRSAKKAEEIYAKTIKEFKQKALPPAINLGSIPDPWTEASTGGADGQPPKPPINRPVASSDPEPEPNKQVKSASKIIQNIDNPTQLQKIGKAFEAIKNQLNNLPEPIKRVLLGARTLLSAFAGFQILQQAGVFFRQFTTDSFQAALNMERLETVLNFSTGNAESSLAKLKIQADRLGISFLSSAKNYQQFSASVINTPLEFQKDKIFEGITLGLATRGASSQQQDRALLAITQIASKGRVSMEELNSQLGEAMPGALQIAARSMGLTSQEFIKLVESGSILAEDLLPKLATQINLESAGGLSVIDDTAFAQVARVQNQIELLRISLGESLLNASKLGLPLITKGLEILTKNGQSLATVLTSIGVVSAGGFIMVLKNIGLIDLGLKALGVTAASTRGAISQIGVGLLKGLGWTALIYGVMEAFKELYQYINAGSEESKRSLKSTQESLQELRRLLEKPLPTPKASTVITDSATAIQRFKNNRERDKSLEFTAGGLIDTTQILRLSTDTFSDTKITEFTGKLDTLRQKAKDLKVDEIIASGDADVKKATSVRQEIAKVNQEIQALTEKYFPQIGLIVNEIASTEERITATKKVLDDPESSKSQKDNASIQLEVAEAQLRKLKESQEKYNEAVKENLINYQRLTEQINKVARALSNIEFISNGRTILSETNIKRQVLSGNLKRFEIDLAIREQSLSIVKDQFNSLNELLATKEKELQNTLTNQINQRITELMPELNGLDFRTALQQGSVSPEAIGDRLQQLGDQSPFELKQVLETAKQQASIRRQTLTIDKSIVDTELEIANARRERARNARQASIVGANVNERIATLRQLPLGGPAASYRDALSEVRNQERLLEEAYRRLESASDDPSVIQQEVDNTRLALEQARANLLQQQTSLQDYYRNLDRQIVDFNRQIEDYRRQTEDAQLSAFKENRSLSESYSDLVRELDKNLLNAQNQLLDTTDRIRVQQVKNRLLIPGTSDAGKELGDIFLEFVQGQADLASRGRTFQSRTEEIETSYISTLRNIRNLQEQQQEAERNRLRTIEDIKRTQENLNRTLADLIRQTNKELGFIPQSIKDIVTNLNTLPEPIKLINSELVAIPPNIKTSGEDLVKSIEETAEAIRKAKEGLILPAPSNFIPAPVWNGRGFLPPPPSLKGRNNFRQTFNGSEFKNIPRNIFVYPVPNGQITGDQGDQHRGVDVFAPVGTPVLNIRSGRIVSAGPGGTINKEDSNPSLPGYQNQHSIKIQFDIPIVVDGKTLTHAYYTHLTDLAQNFQVGQQVEEGVVLGGVGMAGGAPHLHLGLSETANFRGRSALSNRDTLRVFDAIANQQKNTVSSGFPKVPFASLIEGAARQVGIDPLLFAALIKKESSFHHMDPNYPTQIHKSSAGAIGLSQLMPGTAKELGVNPLNPTENLIGGATYLARMLERFNGNIELAISAYKAGPGNVRNGQLAKGTVEDVKIVMQYYHEFLRQFRRNQGGPEFSSPPPIAQLPTLPNQNQDNFWDADLPPVPKDNPINFQSPNLPPVPNLPTGNLGAAADQIRNAETANQNADEFLRRLEEQQNLNNTLDRAMKFRQQQEEDARNLNRTIRDASESVTDLTINSKGYLTVQEEINKSATEVSRQYRSQIESLQDQRRTLLLNADAQKKYSDAIKELLREFQKKGIALPPEFVKEMTDSINVLAKRAESAKEQVTILDQAIEQLGRNQGIATLEASFRKTRDTVRSIRDRLNDLTIQRTQLEFQSRPTLFDDSAILAERISLQKEKEELEDYLEPYKDLPQYAEYVANIRSEWEKLAELRLERAELDASPNRGAAESFFSDIREGKGIGSAFSSLGLNIMTKFVEGITKPAIDVLASAIDGFIKPITQAFESVFNAIIGPVGNFFTNALNSIFKPVGNIFSSIFGGGGGGGLFNSLLSGITGIFSGGLGSIGSLGSIGASSFASAPASAFSLGTGFSLFSDGGKVGDANVPIEKNIISAFQRERSMSGGRKPRLIVANEDELVLNPKETEAYLEYRNNAPIKNYANGGFVGGKPNYSTTSNTNSSNQSLVINNTNNVTVESRNDMGYSLNQLKERENAQNERTKKRFFG